MTERRRIAISLPCTGEEEWRATRDPLMSGWITQGPKVAEFEQRFAVRHSVSHALAVTSCTTGLHLILAGMGIGPGDEVILPAFTWVATANVVLYCGATPVFVDIERESYNLDLSQVAERVTDRTRAVIAVHLFGRCVDVAALRKVLPDSVAVVEDAACAAGADWNGVPAGALGDAASFSFHPRKSITTGEGGMVTTQNAGLAECMNQLRNHGASLSEEQRHHGPRPHLLPEFNLLGFNYRMTDLQGAVGLVQLNKLDQFIEERSKWAAYYQQQLSGIEWLDLPSAPERGRHGWQAYVTYVRPECAPASRNALMDRLQELGIATRPGTHAVHMLEYYRQRFDLTPDCFPVARDCNNQTMAIPLHNRMSDDDYRYIVEALKGL